MAGELNLRRVNVLPPGLGRLGVGNHPGMDLGADRPPVSPAASLWLEAEVAVQCDLDEDVRLEALGLAIAEMSDVLLFERLAALPAGAPLEVMVRAGRRYAGKLVEAGSDFILVRQSSDYLIPASAIVCVVAAPRVLHLGDAVAPAVAPSSWRVALRELLGERVHAIADRLEVSGRLTWVGRDHVSIKPTMSDEVTIAWPHVDAIVVPLT